MSASLCGDRGGVSVVVHQTFSLLCVFVTMAAKAEGAPHWSYLYRNYSEDGVFDRQEEHEFYVLV